MIVIVDFQSSGIFIITSRPCLQRKSSGCCDRFYVFYAAFLVLGPVFLVLGLQMIRPCKASSSFYKFREFFKAAYFCNESL